MSSDLMEGDWSPQSAHAVATLFVSQDGRHALAFRGTVGCPPIDFILGRESCVEAQRNWYTNIAGTVSAYEGSVAYAQIRDAVQIGEDVVRQHNEVTFVGHSLGARMAIIAGLELGQPAVAFDRAPFGAVERTKWPSLNVSTPSNVVGIRGMADPLTGLSPMGRKDITVRNIVSIEGVVDAIYGHSINLLALAMQDVRIAWENGWLELPSEESAEESLGSSFNGVWHSEEYGYAFEIDGMSGRATLSNSPAFAAGDMILRIDAVFDTQFAGTQMFTDGKWHVISAELVGEDVLQMSGGGYTWQMRKVASTPK